MDCVRRQVVSARPSTVSLSSLPPTVSRPRISSPPRARIWPAITMLTVGVACAFAGLMLFNVVGFAGFESPLYQAPITVARCHVGDYYLYQHIGSQVSVPGFSYSHSGSPTLKPSEVDVRGPDGSRVATFVPGSSDTITKGSWIYFGTVGFHAETPGTYEVHVSDVSPPDMIIAPSIGSQFVRAAPWLIMVAIGELVAVAGLVVLIVRAVRRGRQNQIPAYGWGYCAMDSSDSRRSLGIKVNSPIPRQDEDGGWQSVS